MTQDTQKTPTVSNPVEAVVSSDLVDFKHKVNDYLSKKLTQSHPLYDTTLYNDDEKRVIKQIKNYINNSC